MIRCDNVPEAFKEAHCTPQSNAEYIMGIGSNRQIQGNHIRATIYACEYRFGNYKGVSNWENALLFINRRDE